MSKELRKESLPIETVATSWYGAREADILLQEIVGLLAHTAIAKLIGCNPRTVRRWLRGEYYPSDEYITRMKKLGIWDAMKTLILVRR